MKILIDIGHPAQVHYFKNAISILISNGHDVIVVSREKEMATKLLKDYGITYVSRGKGKNSIIGKLLYLAIGGYKMYYIARKNKIDLFLSFASPYNALASIFYKKPVIAFDDTEHNILNHKLYVPLSDVILTPMSFKKDFGIKQVRFKGTMESAYLHPKYFSLKENVFDNEDSLKNRKNVLLRFVSWNASHDRNQNGFRNEDIIRLINMLSAYANIYISSEKSLPVDLEKYSVKIKPSEMHFFMKKMDLFIGESGSMATEAAYLGTHSIVLNSAAHEFGVFEQFAKFKTFYIAKDFNDVLQKSESLIKNDSLKIEAEKESRKIIEEGICLSDFMVWFVENYPKSAKIMKENPDYQYRFK